MTQHKVKKSTTSMILLSLLRVQDNIILPKCYEKTTGICFDSPEDGDLHKLLNPPSAISVFGWRYQARHYCAYANGLPCLFCLKAPCFTLQRKLLHTCVRFLWTNYKNALQQVLSKLWFIYYLFSWKSFEKCWFKSIVNLMKQKVLA